MESVLVVKADAEALCQAGDQPVSKSLVDVFSAGPPTSRYSGEL